VETAVSTGNQQQLKMVPRRNRGNWSQPAIKWVCNSAACSSRSNGMALSCAEHVQPASATADPSTINSNLFMPPPATVHFTAIGVFGMKQRFLRPGRISHVI